MISHELVKQRQIEVERKANEAWKYQTTTNNRTFKKISSMLQVFNRHTTKYSQGNIKHNCCDA